MADWYGAGLEDDMRPRMTALVEQGRAFTLATIVGAESGPRPVGSQMVITPEEQWGFLSGGCIEDDVARHGREVLLSGKPRTLVYGYNSPFIDMRLPCGGQLTVLVERVDQEDAALAELIALSLARKPARWQSDGHSRRCGSIGPPRNDADPLAVDIVYLPEQRLVVIGHDPFALAIAEAGSLLRWQTHIVRPHGPVTAPSVAAKYSRLPVSDALAEINPDRWTAIAIATHDIDLDHEAIISALASDAGYVGVLGARRRLPERLARLHDVDVGKTRIAKLHAPIGLPIGSASPHEVGISVVAEIIARNRRDTATKRVAA